MSYSEEISKPILKKGKSRKFIEELLKSRNFYNNRKTCIPESCCVVPNDFSDFRPKWLMKNSQEPFFQNLCQNGVAYTTKCATWISIIHLHQKERQTKKEKMQIIFIWKISDGFILSHLLTVRKDRKNLLIALKSAIFSVQKSLQPLGQGQTHFLGRILSQNGPKFFSYFCC